jgi:DNA-binding transcriptional ArsR family regulator
MSRQRARSDDDPKLDLVFQALSDPTRRSILERLTHGAASISELADPFSMTLPAVSKHLRVLERAGLLRRERQGWYHLCHLETRPLEDAASFLARYRPFWESTLDELAKYVENPPHKPKGRR